MTTQKQISLEQLAEKLGGNLWVKGELKRIYLDEGNNTKKMSTKTFVWQNESGEFLVSCKIDCPSQPWQWCKSQEDEIKGSVLRKIENALSGTVFIIVSKDGQYCNYEGKPCQLNNCTYFFNEAEAAKELDNCFIGGYDHFITMPRDEFESEVERLDKIENSNHGN